MVFLTLEKDSGVNMTSYDSSADKIRLITVTTGWSIQHLTQEDVISYLTIAFICYQFAITSPRAWRAAKYWYRAVRDKIAQIKANRKSKGG